MKTISDKLAALITLGVKQGGYRPEHALVSVHEQMTPDEFQAATEFLEWVVANKRKFGHNLPEVWAEHQASKNGLPVLDRKLVNENVEAFVANIPRDYRNLPVFEHSYKSRPSWKTSGEGHARIKVTKSKYGFDFQASEFPENIRGGKEVFVTIPADKVPEFTVFVCEDLLAALKAIAEYPEKNHMTGGGGVPIQEMVQIAKQALADWKGPVKV